MQLLHSHQRTALEPLGQGARGVALSAKNLGALFKAAFPGIPGRHSPMEAAPGCPTDSPVPERNAQPPAVRVVQA